MSHLANSKARTALGAGASRPAPPATRSQEIMVVAMEMAPADASVRDIAVKARTSESWARVALRLLREAPDIAQNVSDGAVGLTHGYRAMFQRKFARSESEQETS